MATMSRLVAYVRQKEDCSMGEIDIQLGISTWKQYALFRAFKEFFPDVELMRSRWRLRLIPEPTVVPIVAQDTLTGNPI